MNGAHLHLLLNHLPVLGTLFGLGILAVGMARRNDTLRRTALVVLFGAGLAAGAAYLTGEPAEDTVENQAVSKNAIEAHEEAAEAALIGAGVLAALAGIALLRWRREIPQGVAGVMLVGSLATSGLMAWTANLGGQIRHPEITGETSAALGPAAGGERERGEDRD